MDVNTFLGIALTVAGISEFIVAKSILPKAFARNPNTKPESVKIVLNAITGMGVLILLSALCVFVFKPL